MGYNFTETVRASFAPARREAQQLGHEYVGTEHMLLGLLAAERGVARDMSLRLNVECESVAQKLRAIIRSGNRDQRMIRSPTTTMAATFLRSQ